MATVVLAGLIALFGGCGGGEVAVDATALPSVPGTSGITHWDMAMQVPESWTLLSGDVEAMRTSDDVQTLVVEVELLPVRLSDASHGPG